MFQLRLQHEMEGLYGTANHNHLTVAMNDEMPVPSNPALPTTVNHSHTTEAAQSANMHPDVATVQIAHSCSATVSCRWGREGNSEPCGTEITCGSVSKHFGDRHGIKKLGSGTLIRCLWEGCDRQVIRQNFTRHIREPHLGHPRKKQHPS
ncbi:hypothetical protein J3R83DRAFT_5631 [Lanmaoa asiatica]|nr:hypothetical protein J3R83DRAFT_5631 [Lanmaoa asiatica]